MKVYSLRRSSGMKATHDAVVVSSFYERDNSGAGEHRRHVRVALQKLNSVEETVLLLDEVEARTLVATLIKELQ